MELNQVRIPGKVMLSGEYAVLHGGTAVLAPVPRWLTVTEAIEAPDVPASPVLATALSVPIDEIASWEEKHPLLHVQVDRSEFTTRLPNGSRIKLGLGSSAAEAVGVIALRLERAGIRWQDNRERVARLADTAHRIAQGGLGSGADVAACAYGVPIRFSRPGGELTIDTIHVCAEPLPLTLAWTGIAADTRVLVPLFEWWLETDPGAEELLNELLVASEVLAGAWYRPESEALLTYLDRFCTVMQICADHAHLPWSLPEHRRIAGWARGHGGRAKPTGAGGGDLALLVGELPLDQRSEPLIPL